MRKKDIDRFFLKVSSRIKIPFQIYLTGGVASWFLGGNRPTHDIDFALKTKKEWEQIEQIIREVSRELSIAVEFSEDISRWGMIGISDFEKGAKLYKRFGSIDVYILDPLIWSVGK